MVLGISADPQASQLAFAQKLNLPYRLLCDTEHKAAEAFGAWAEKNNYGKKYWGINRSTFVIDAQGKIAKIFSKVNIEGHPQEVLAAVRAADSAG